MSLWPWVIIALLVAINAFFVAAEFAAVAVDRGRIALLARHGNRRAAGLSAVLEDGAELDRSIAACQIGITLSSLIAGAYGQATIAIELAPMLADVFSLGDTAAHTMAFLVVLLMLTTLQVVLGELVPKSLALQFPDRMALGTHLPLRWAVSAFRPFIWFLNGSGFLLLKPFGITPGGHQHVHSPEEIAILLAESRREGNLSDELHRRLDHGLHLSDRSVRQLMTPRHEIDAIEVSTPFPELLRRLMESPYSRLPVYRDSLDDVLGTVSTKDVVALFVADGDLPPLEKLLRPIPFVPESLDAHRFVRFLQDEHSSKAIVVDEHGGVQGLISIDDVLSQVFGGIGDELKQPESGPERLPDGTVRLPGALRLDDAEAWLPVRWTGSAATVGGHVVNALGRLPSAGERLDIDGASVTVTEMGRTAIRWIVVHPDAPPDMSDAATMPPGDG